MRERKEMDANVTLREQVASSEQGPLVLVNIFTVDPAEADQLLSAWADDAAYFKRQPGFISAQLHRGIAGSAAFLNYAVWQDLATFRAAFTNPDFQAKLAGYPPSTTASPHLFRKLAVPNICVS